MSEQLHPMSERPPEHRDPKMRLICTSAVMLVWASGRLECGWFDMWTGWVFDLDGLPSPVENEAEQPIGWRSIA